jgi:hypothetical protein
MYLNIFVVACIARDFEFLLYSSRIFNRPIEGVRLIDYCFTLVSWYIHQAISFIVSYFHLKGTVNGDLVMIGTKSMSMCVCVWEESSLKHFVVSWLHSRHHVSWTECRLLYLWEIVLRVPVEDHLSNRYQGVISMGPHLSDVIDIPFISFSFSLRHYLNIESPRGEVSLIDVLEEVLKRLIRIQTSHYLSLVSSKVFDSLVRLPCILHEMDIASFIDPFECVLSESIYVSEWSRSASIAE